MPTFSLSSAFDKDVWDDFAKVSLDILMLVQKRIPGSPPAGDRPIICDLWSEKKVPKTITYKEHYQINLTQGCKDRRYAKFTYQLSHELGHVQMGTLRSNGLIETLATLLSHQILEDMAEKWRVNPPYRNWVDYAPQFLTYVENEKTKHLEKFPLVVRTAVEKSDWETVAQYMHHRKHDQIADACDRDLNALGAILLQNTDFKKDSLLWRKLRGVAWCTNPSPPSVGAYHEHTDHTLQLEMDQLPIELRESFGYWLGY